VEGFNKVRREKITTSVWDILDEKMSNFRPRLTPTSKLPNIYCILRKPEPLGSEFKCVACPVVGTMKCLEIQRGAKPMLMLNTAKSMALHLDAHSALLMHLTSILNLDRSVA
jgi:hypothetical protein